MFRTAPFRLAPILVLLALAPAPTGRAEGGGEPGPPVAAADGQRSQARAWELLAGALEHHAPGGLPAEEALRIEWTGTLWPRSQSRTSEPPFDPPFPVRWESTIGPERVRVVLDQEIRWPNFLSRRRSVVGPDDAFDVDLGSGALVPPMREPGERLARSIRLVPPLLLAEILEESPGALRYLGASSLDGEGTRAVAALHRGALLDLHLGEDGALVGWGRMTSEPMLGDAWAVVRFSRETVERAGLRLPRRTSRSVRGVGVEWEVELASAARTALDPALLERPEPPEGGVERTEAAPPEPTPEPRLEQAPEALAEGVFLFPVPGSPDYRSLVVERRDHLVLVEAPVGEGPTGRLLEALAERFPGKPIRFVVATHHHFDHSGGVPAAVAAGAALVTTPGNVAFFRRAIAGPRTLEGRAPAPPPEIRAVSEPWRVPGGPPAVEVLPVEPTPHVEEMLAVHLPGAKLLFQGDLARFPLPADEPLRPQVAALDRLIRSRGLDVERIAGVHGEVGSREELEERLAREEAAPLSGAGENGSGR